MIKGLLKDHVPNAVMALWYWLFVRGLQRGQLATTITLSLTEPMPAATLGVMVLGEQLTSSAFAGICLIFIGLVILNAQRFRLHGTKTSGE
nr:EamA family transporter [uncultured Desulfobulbus sp.]